MRGRCNFTLVSYLHGPLLQQNQGAFLFLPVVPHHDEGNGKEYQHDAQGYSGGEALMEDQHTDKEGGDRLQGSQDRGVCGTDEVDAHSHENQGNDGREQCQSEGTSPLHQPGRNLQVDASPQPYDVDDEAEQQGIEREFHGREGLQERAVHPHDVDGIAQGGEEDQQAAHEAHHAPVAGVGEQGNAHKRQQDAGGGNPGHLLLEENNHDDGREDGVDEQQGTGNTRIHIVVCLEEREGREGEQDSHGSQDGDFFPPEPEGALLHLHDDAYHEEGEGITVEQHRIGSHTCGIERQGEQRVQSVAGSSQCPGEVTFKIGDIGGHLCYSVQKSGAKLHILLR